MPRSDLLALSAEDLAALTNRGTVKRAQREVGDEKLSCQIEESDEGLTVEWSDGTICSFPAGQTIHEAVCSSGSLGISRHIVRSVFAYQGYIGEEDRAGEQPQQQPADHEPSADSLSVPSTAPEPSAWDPGTISDADLENHFRKTAVNKARKVFDQGVLVELTRGSKPSARFLHESCTVRFPVPGDVRYAMADCAETQLAQWASMAVWAFRAFPPERSAGLLSLQQSELPVPEDELDQLSDLLLELCTDGMGGISETWHQRLSRLEKRLRNSGLVWPAELVTDLLHQHQQYQQQDARFSPHESVRLIGELIARSRAIRTQKGSVPQALVRGNKSDRRTDIKAARFVGLGLGVRPGRRHTRMHAYFQDAGTGAVVAVQRVFTDPDTESSDPPRSFEDLATHGLARGVTLGSAAVSQLLLGSGKRTPTDELVLPRGDGKQTTNPQTFQWEQLSPPLAIDNFAQARQRFESLPPDWLRPRRHTENLHVLAVNAVTGAEFDTVHQQLSATLVDVAGDQARLVFPYHRRGERGFSELLNALQNHGGDIRYVCGHVRLAKQQLEIQPITVVFQPPDQQRRALSTWIGGGGVGAVASEVEAEEQAEAQSSITDFLGALIDQISDAMVTGLDQANHQTWDELEQAARQLGFLRLAEPIGMVAQELSLRNDQLRWKADQAAKAMGQLCMLSRILE